MINKNQFQRFLTKIMIAVIISSAILFVSCEKEQPIVEEPEVAEEPSLKCAGNKGLGLLLDYEIVNTMTTEQILGVVGPAFASLLEYDVNMYKVRYLSMYRGWPIVVSGIVGIPDTDVDRNTPIVMYNHGTRMSEGDYPPSSGLDLLTVVAASNGKICLAADYVGYGESKHLYHSYMINTAAVAPVCDMILAGKQFLMREFRIYGKLSLTMFGYSQGGSVTQEVQRELESNPFYRWFVKLNGVATGTGPYDLHDNVVMPMISAENYAGSAFTVYLFVSYNKFYCLGYDLDEIFQNGYGQQLLEQQANNKTFAEINGSLPTAMADLFQPEFRQDFIEGNTPFNALFAENVTHKGWAPKAPTRIYHSKADEIVPYVNAQNAYNSFIEYGAKNVELITYEDYNHTTTAFMSVFEILDWADELNSKKNNRW